MGAVSVLGLNHTADDASTLLGQFVAHASPRKVAAASKPSSVEDTTFDSFAGEAFILGTWATGCARTGAPLYS